MVVTFYILAFWFSHHIFNDWFQNEFIFAYKNRYILIIFNGVKIYFVLIIVAHFMREISLKVSLYSYIFIFHLNDIMHILYSHVNPNQRFCLNEIYMVMYFIRNHLIYG